MIYGLIFVLVLVVQLDFSEHAPDVMNNNDNEYSFNKGNGIVHSDHQPVLHWENGHAKANGHFDCGHVHRKKGALHQVFKAEFETVGCTAVDSLGNCAAATSTGGLVNKMSGRIGKKLSFQFSFSWSTYNLK